MGLTRLPQLPIPFGIPGRSVRGMLAVVGVMKEHLTVVDNAQRLRPCLARFIQADFLVICPDDQFLSDLQVLVLQCVAADFCTVESFTVRKIPREVLSDRCDVNVACVVGALHAQSGPSVVLE